MKITTKITAWYAALTIILMVILVPILYLSASSSVTESLRQRLSYAVEHAEDEIEEKDEEHDNDEEDQDKTGILDLDDLIDTDFLEDESIDMAILREDGTILAASPHGAWLASVQVNSLNHQITRNGREWYIAQKSAKYQGEHLVIRAAGNTSYWHEASSTLLKYLVLIIPVYILLAVLGAWLLSRRSVRPISKITESANKIAAGDLSERIEVVNAKDEIGNLAKTLNHMLDELEVSFKREQQFTSDASHELRTPVTVIAACADDALAVSQDPETRFNLEAIKEECKRMTGLISQLLTLSRGYEGRLHFEPEEIDLYDVAESVAETLKNTADQKQIHIYNELVPETLARVDQSLMSEVFLNLVGNAIKYGNDGGTIRMSTETTPEHLKIIFQDDGIGISPADLPHIFERFYRADKSRDRSGTGLGLSIVKWIVEMHGGTITAKSRLGEGSQFVVELPSEK